MIAMRARGWALCLGWFSACGNADEGATATDAAADPDAAQVEVDASRATIDANATTDAGADSTAPSAVVEAGVDTACRLTAPPGSASSKWAAIAADGTLSYAALDKGDTLLDFSTAGYHGGGVALPVVGVKQSVKPSGGDDTKAIQAAIDAVSALPIVAGSRGAVLLEPGTFQLAGTLNLNSSGVVLRGSGAATGGTILNVTGAPRTAIAVGGSGSYAKTGAAVAITDTYVASGSRTVHVADASSFAVGDSVLLERPVTDAWLHFMGMDTLVRDGAKQTWLSDTTVIDVDRTITAIEGDAVTFDASLPDAIDATYARPPGASLTHYGFAGRITEVGLESFQIVAPSLVAPLSSPTFQLLEMDAVRDGWVRDVAGVEFENGFEIGSAGKQITIDGCSMVRTSTIDGSAGYPFHYSVAGEQVLVLRSSSSGPHVFSYATQARTVGPNVVFDFHADGTPTDLQPHQRWATGLLIDSTTSTGGGIDLMDRGYDGSGHGWAIGFSVVWNSTADSFLIQQPPGSMNWAIGSTGKPTSAAAPGSTSATPEPNGIYDSPGKPVAPASLYLAQLCLRLGPSAITAIGYPSP